MLFTQEQCYKCNEITNHFNGKCGSCAEKQERQEKDEHFYKLDNMTLEERIRRLEKNEYNTWKNPPDFDRLIC